MKLTHTFNKKDLYSNICLLLGCLVTYLSFASVPLSHTVKLIARSQVQLSFCLPSSGQSAATTCTANSTETTVNNRARDPVQTNLF